MRVLLGFAPFIAFSLALRAMPLVEACLLAAAIGFGLLLRDRLLGRRSVKILEAGSVLLYGGLALLHPAWPAWAIWAVSDSGLLLIAVASLALGQPFTLQYAREQVAPELWNNPVFMMANRRITAVWAGAFAVMALSEVAVAVVPGASESTSKMVSVLALLAALWFTRWYPAYIRRAHAAAQPVV